MTVMSTNEHQTTIPPTPRPMADSYRQGYDAGCRAGLAEGYRRVLLSSRTMTREMLIQWLEHEVSGTTP